MLKKTKLMLSLGKISPQTIKITKNLKNNLKWKPVSKIDAKQKKYQLTTKWIKKINGVV